MDAQCQRTGEACWRMMTTVRFVLVTAIVAYLVIVVAMYMPLFDLINQLS